MTEIADMPIIDPTDDTLLLGAESHTPSAWTLYNGIRLMGSAPAQTIVVQSAVGTKQFVTTVGIDNVATIEAALDYAVASLPNVDVEFGPGFYDIEGGTRTEIDSTLATSRGLHIHGAGFATVFRFIGDSAYATGKWFCIRIIPTVLPTIGDFDNYLHDISITDMSAFDEAPYLHATTEETHGFNIQYTVRANLSRLNLNNIGDEGVEADYCHNITINNNICYRCNIAEEGGGAALSCKNGSGEVTIVGNTVTDNIPDDWDPSKTYAANERARGSDGITYKSVAGGNQGNDPISTSPASWTDLSSGGLLNYGIDIKLAAEPPLDAQVTNVVISGNTIARIEFSGIQISNTHETSANIVISDCNIDTTIHGISKKGNGTKRLVASNLTMTNLTGNMIQTTTPTPGDDSDWIVSNVIGDTIGGDFLALTNMKGLKAHDCKITNMTGAAFDGDGCSDIRLINNEFEDSGNTGQVFVEDNVLSTGMEFSNNKVINCASSAQFIRRFNIVNHNDIDMANPSFQSFDDIASFNGNIANGSVRKTTDGIFQAMGNKITIDFELDNAQRAAIICGFNSSLNKGSQIRDNTITNNSPLLGVCIFIDDQGVETANVIVDGNHCGIGSNDEIDDNATGTVFGTTNVATVI